MRCLDGGAWDRSTWYGQAPTLAEADALAARKLAAWLGTMGRPVTYMDEDGQILVVRMPLRPRDDMQVLYRAKDADDARRFIESVATEEPGAQT